MNSAELYHMFLVACYEEGLDEGDMRRLAHRVEKDSKVFLLMERRAEEALPDNYHYHYCDDSVLFPPEADALARRQWVDCKAVEELLAATQAQYAELKRLYDDEFN